MSEHDQQVLVFGWAAVHEYKWPCLYNFYAIPNQGSSSKKADIIRTKKMMAEGQKTGMLDTCLPVARQGYHALYIEMKDGKYKYLSKDQKDRKAGLEAEGNRVEVAYSGDEAIDILVDYLTKQRR